MKHEKKEARQIINDLIEQHCQPCKKHIELKVSVDQFNKYCNTHCPAGRDLKRLGDYLDKGDEVKMAIKEKVKPTIEACEDLLAQGKTNKEIAEAFGISQATLYHRKKEWGLLGERGGSRTKKEVAAEVETPNYTLELEKYQLEIEGLKYSNKMLTEQLKEKSNIEAYNRETYEELTRARETLKEKDKTITALFAEFRVLEKKYESLVTYTKAIM